MKQSPTTVKLSIEIVYAPATHPNPAWLRVYHVAAPCTVQEVITLSGILTVFPEIDLNKTHRVGVFSRFVSLEQVLKNNDRVEIYRPLQQDPKELRRRRVRKVKGKVIA